MVRRTADLLPAGMPARRTMPRQPAPGALPPAALLRPLPRGIPVLDVRAGRLAGRLEGGWTPGRRRQGGWRRCGAAPRALAKGRHGARAVLRPEAEIRAPAPLAAGARA